MLCPECSATVKREDRFCAACGQPVDASRAPTVAGTPPSPPGTPPSPPGPPAVEEARLLPGTVVAERYRIVALLGRGGMGEVYRADDLRLGQPVALKFLPRRLPDYEDRLSRFLTEVRIARQVSHPNVCRVYDVDEADGRHYLSMEYVDGEDLATLLRRIGRLPEDKALQIARQLCAGLAAAHGLGVLHRDLKPANVLIDGRGQAKLTDFGLAALADAVDDAEARAGTPGYMAPEQIAGRGVSVASDIYSLGLVLHELFTGRRPFDAGGPAELAPRRCETTPVTPSSFLRAFDPAVERVILQCLERDPARRPASALAVAAALPGGDPLAAALAAGETPSPEMVAAAGPVGGLRPAVAGGCLAAIVLLTVANYFPTRSLNPHDHLPLSKSYEALAENAREIAVRLGYDARPADRWAGYGYDFLEYFHLVRQHGPAAVQAHLRRPGQPILWLGYRQDDGPLVPLGLDRRVSFSAPAPTAGEVAVRVDLQGRLTALRVIPSWGEIAGQPPEVDWGELFELAGLDLARFEAVAPMTRPDSFADTRRAWTGVLPDYGNRPVRIEAAALDGRPISFQQILPSDPRWTVAGGQVPEVAVGLFTAAGLLFIVLGLAVAATAVFFAVRNLKLGRGDRRGAFRLAVFVFAMRFLHWALAGDHVGHPDEMVPLALTVSGALTLAFLAWTVYMACEPYVRRLWPEALISWTRVLAGRPLDPLVGRDVLVGCTVTALQGLVVTWAWWAAARAGIVGVVPLEGSLVLMRGGRYAVGELFSTLLVSTAFALAIMLVVLVLRLLCRWTWIAGVVLCLLWGGIAALQFAGLFGPRAAVFGLFFQAFNAAVVVVLLVRFGLLAAVVGAVSAWLGRFAVFTLDPASPLFGLGLFVTGVGLAIAVYGWRASLAGRLPVRDPLAAPFSP